MKFKQKMEIKSCLRTQRGTSLVELALMLPFLLLLVLVAIDFGRAYYISIEVNNAARAGAQYGILNPSDTAGMVTAATADASDITMTTPVATTGCMCADGTLAAQTPCSSSSPPACGGGTRLVNFVTVTTSIAYTPLFIIPGVIGPITIRGAATFPTGT